jgi:N6-adenosine-specific RNA methylase IME4
MQNGAEAQDELRRKEELLMTTEERKSEMALPHKRYSVIMADPPWDIQQKGAYGAEQHYDLMSLERIKAMPVADLATENAHLWLWVTNATLRVGYDVMEAWGFTPRSPLTWIKPRFTLGVYLRNATEHLILGTRGKAPVHFKSQPTWMFAPLQEHSHKPEEQYAVIDRVSGNGSKLELFARRRQPGWDVWGNQIDSDIEIPGYPLSAGPAIGNNNPRKES